MSESALDAGNGIGNPEVTVETVTFTVPAGESAGAASDGSTSSSSAADDNVVDAEVVDEDEKDK